MRFKLLFNISTTEFDQEIAVNTNSCNNSKQDTIFFETWWWW